MGAPDGTWVTIEDQYDHDRHKIGPFPTVEDASRYCDAYNGVQLKMPATGVPAELGAPTDLGVWNVADCRGYDVKARLLAMLAEPQTIPLDADAIAARHGARDEREWHRAAQAAIGAKRCWCAELRAGQVPSAPSEVLSAYLALGVERERSLFETAGHDGDANVHRCRLCGGRILHLMVELKGFGNCIHHYYMPMREDDLAALAAGTLNRNTCEGWIGGRPGLHRDGYIVCAYGRASVGHIGFDHHLYDVAAAPSQE